MKFLGLYSVYLMKYAGNHFLEQSGRFENVVLKTPTPVHKTPTTLSPLPHEGTKLKQNNQVGLIGTWVGVLGTLVLCMLNQRGGGRYRKKWGGLFRHVRKYKNMVIS